MAEELVIENRRKRPRGGRVACCVLALLVLLIVLLILLLVLAFITEGFGMWKTKVCLSKECVQAGARLVRYMDTSADPCQDFYQYACGNFASHHLIPPGHSTIHPFEILHAEEDRNLKFLLEQVNPDDPDYVKETKTFYRSCMNETKIDELGIRPIKEYIRNLGGWAVVDKNYDLSKFEFEDYWVKLSLDTDWPGYDNKIFGLTTGSDPDRSTDRIIYLRQVNPGMGEGSRDQYIEGRDNKVVKAYEKMINDVARMLGADTSYAEIEIAKLVSFEIELAKISVKLADLADSANKTNLVTLNELGSLYKGIDWKRIIVKSFETVGIKVKDTQRVKVFATDFFESLGNLVQGTHSKVLAGYMMWRSVYSNLNLLDKTTRNIIGEFSAVKYGVKSEKPRFEKCVDSTNRYFPWVVARIYSDKYFLGKLEDIEQLIQYVKDVFKKRLEKSEWLDRESIEKAIEKTQAMKANVGYPAFIKDNAKLEAKFNKRGYDKMKPDNYFLNVVGMTHKRGQIRWKKLEEPVDKSEWTSAPLIVNAMYYMGANLMVYPLGILFPPFYDSAGLKALNFGAIGEVIGHEITHGFDNNGRSYDKNGNKKQWMTQASVDGFTDKVQCVKYAYNNITVKQIGENVDGKLTLGENIADIGGLADAYQAYQQWVSENGMEDRLPGLDLNPSQLFFLNYAQVSCSLFTDEVLKVMIQADTHTPNRERVLGALYNTEAFADVYRCPEGSKMNPENKCHIW